MKKKKTGVPKGAFHLNGHGTELLFEAIEAKQTKTVGQLIRAGVSPNAKDRYGYSALFRVVEWGTQEMAEAVLKAGAEPNWAHHAHKMTPLQAVLQEKRRKGVAKLLVKYGANPFGFSDGRFSYAEIAELNGNAHVFKTLPAIRERWEKGKAKKK